MTRGRGKRRIDQERVERGISHRKTKRGARESETPADSSLPPQMTRQSGESEIAQTAACESWDRSQFPSERLYGLEVEAGGLTHTLSIDLGRCEDGAANKCGN